MYAELINQSAIDHNLRPDIVACVILQESSGNTFAYRYEPEFYDRYLKDKKRGELAGWVPGEGETPTLDSEKMARATSWGLMQVMGDTARWCANVTTPDLTVLVTPELGIDAGCRVLAYYLNKESNNYTRALARYNAGSVSALGLIYADKILTRVKNGEYVKLIRSE